MAPWKARYGHTNLVARDWRRLAGFYVDLFGCVHLRLPGHGDDGPTLEIYAYEREEPALPPAANRPGWGHIAFAVDNVPAAQHDVLAAGGSAVGEVVTVETADGRRVTWCYVTDPEGNIVELQAWSDGQ